MTWRERWARWRLWLGFGPKDPVRQMIEQTPHYRPWHWNDPDPVSGLDLSALVFFSCARPVEKPDDARPYDWERDGL